MPVPEHVFPPAQRALRGHPVFVWSDYALVAREP
jgi:hypothetical protein